MSSDYCRGCGSVIQSEDKSKPGYVPEATMARKGVLICQRCYQISHYGKAGTIQPELSQIRQNINKAISQSEYLLLVVDFSDLTGSLPLWAEYLKKPYFLVLNKVDLLPSRTEPEEILEYLEVYLHSLKLPQPEKMIMISSLKGRGIDYLRQELSKKLSSGTKLAVLGATNVGKSSLIKQILQAEESTQAPTVSKFPGTTLGLSNWSIFKGRNTLIDTPGLTPGDRLTDLFCPDCVTKLVPSTQLTQKLWGLKPGQGISIGGLCGLELQSTEETVVIAFTAGMLKQHRGAPGKTEQLLLTAPEWLNQLCKVCRNKVEWQAERIELAPNTDLAIAGLGWFSIRGKTKSTFDLWLPKQIRWEIRPALIGKKDFLTNPL